MALKILNTSFDEVKLLVPEKHSDSRGFFSETWNMNALKQEGINLKFVQENHSLSHKKSTLRGLHFQKPPFAQLKLVRCGRGSFLDVFVDLRSKSKTFGNCITPTKFEEEFNDQFLFNGNFKFKPAVHFGECSTSKRTLLLF